jgi:hypothetical protein
MFVLPNLLLTPTILFCGVKLDIILPFIFSIY